MTAGATVPNTGEIVQGLSLPVMIQIGVSDLDRDGSVGHLHDGPVGAYDAVGVIEGGLSDLKGSNSRLTQVTVTDGVVATTAFNGDQGGEQCGVHGVMISDRGCERRSRRCLEP